MQLPLDCTTADIERRPLIGKDKDGKDHDLNYTYGYCKRHNCGEFELCLDLRCPHCEGAPFTGAAAGKGHNDALDELEKEYGHHSV